MADKGGTDRGTSFKDKDKKGAAAAAAAEDGEVDDTAVKHLSLDFQSGQRILSRVHILCQGFREQAKQAMDGVKAKEYQIAKQEVMKAQARIDQARIEQIEKISETQARQLTALEKARLKQLQDMQKNDAKAAERLVSTPFVELLSQDGEANPFVGVQVEEIIEQIVTPFCVELCAEVDKLYSVNQKMMKLAAVCHKETLKHQQKIQDLKAQLAELEQQSKFDADHMKTLKSSVQQRNSQLRIIRDAYEKEVIAVKVQTAQNARASVDETVNSASRAFASELLPDKIGQDASGQDLDVIVSKYTATLQEQMAKIPSEPPGGIQFDKKGKRIEDDTFDSQVKIMKLENELAQQQIKNLILRQGLESWRNRASKLFGAKS
eukprot:Tamp_16929.p1 GENE.Tamp_16929~~Tamp_16929.p1  ORF type:complete len:385 (+),score=130.45 Tamp_16929:22-1155(+)